MKEEKYIIALDQGTTSSRSVLINKNGEVVGLSQKETTQIYPQNGWVEHDPAEILKTQLSTFQILLKENKVLPTQIVGIGITNQRETTVLWDKNTGKPIYNAIVWQDKRTIEICQKLKDANLESYINKTTGLVIDAYFSATKIAWILNNVEGARQSANNNELLFGTIDTWLLWNLTKGKVHATDYSNASRTMLYDINNLKWDEKILNALNIPLSILPTVKPSSFHYGYYEIDKTLIPIAGIAGDQQAALFGQKCFSAGQVKNTYGTGCFMLMNTGEQPKQSRNGLLTTIAWGIDDKVYYAIEGSVFIAGAAIQWLRDGLKIISTAKESESISEDLKDDNPVIVVPAFAGLGAPYWDMKARGAIYGLTQDTGRSHIVQATLESLAYQTKDIINAMQEDSSIKLTSLKVDGGASQNNYLMQFQSNILNIDVERPKYFETTALGAGFLAGLHLNFWTKEELENMDSLNKIYEPRFDKPKIEKLYKKWQKAIKRTMDWED